MRSLALILFAVTTLAACAPPKAAPGSTASTSAPEAAERAPSPEPEPSKTEPPKPAQPAAEEPVPVDPLTGLPPAHLVKAYGSGQLKLPKPPPLHTEKPNACRSPGEPGCARCCNKSDPSGCNGGEGSPEPPGNGSPPWFSAQGWMSDGPCPADCKPCARCTLRDEWELSKVPVPDPQCDCTKTYPGVDHCYSPTSCGCVCATIRGLVDRCPHLHPARAK